MFLVLFHIVYAIFFVVSSTILYLGGAIVRLITGPFDPRLFIMHRYACFWASVYIWTMPFWKVRVVGREKIRHDATYMVVSNHQSMVDILVAYHLFFHFKWVAKAELKWVPFIGWNMALNRYIFVKRGDRQSIIDMMRDSEAYLREGNSVYIFPEGTRSETGETGEFKAGAFSLAQKTSVPVLPIAIAGTKDALPKGSFFIRGRHEITVTVLDEISADDVAATEPRELAKSVRKQIVETIREEGVLG